MRKCDTQLYAASMQEHVDVRDQITKSRFPSTDELRPLVAEIARRIVASGRDEPVPKLRCGNAVPLHGVPGCWLLAAGRLLLPCVMLTHLAGTA